MARIRDYATTIYAAATTANMVMDMPVHVEGDLLLAFVGKDAAFGFTTPSTSVGTPVSSSNWTLIRSSTSTGAGGGIYALRATSASENVTFPLAIDTCVGTIISIKEVYGSTVADAVPASVAYGATDSTLPFAGVGITTTYANALLFSHRYADTTVGTAHLPPWVNIFAGDAANGGSSVAYSFEPTASTAVAAPSMWSGGEDDGQASMCEVRDLYQDLGVFGNIAITNNDTITKSSGTSFITSGVRAGETITIATAEDAANDGLWTVATVAANVITVTSATLVNNADDDAMRIYAGSSGGSIMSYIPLDVVPSVQISPLTGTTGTIDRGAYIAAASIAITSVAGKTVTGVTVSATADAGYNPFRGSMTTAGASSTTGLAHTEFDLTATQDVTTGDLIFGTYMHTGPRDYLDSGNVARGGKYILLGSTSGNWRAWVVGGQFSKTDSPNVRINFLIEPSYTTTQYTSAGTANYASLDYLAFGSSGYFGAPSIRWNELWELRTAVLAGGSATAPFNFDDLIFTVNSGCGNIPVLQQSGSSAVVWIPLQFGGNEKIGISINLRTFQWSRQASPTTGYVDCHVSDGALGVEFYGTGANDYLHFTNCVFTRDTPYYWRFNASHSASADIDFSGTSVIGANVTLRSTVTLDSMTFIDSASLALNSAALTNSTFDNSKVSTSVIAELADIQNSSFISSGTGYAIEVTGTAGNVTLTGLTFTGYASTDGSTGNEAIFVNIGSGTCNITIIGGTVPSIRTAGATVVVIEEPRTFTVTVKDLETGSVIQNARVIVPVTNGDNFPYQVVVTIAGTGTTATVTHTGHGRATGDNILIAGASPDYYNGAFTITKIDANSYSYTTADTIATSPATGTITATMVLLNGLTNASGVITDSRTYSANQSVSGWVRRHTYGPSYTSATWTDGTSTLTKTGAFTGMSGTFLITITAGTNMTSGVYLATWVNANDVTLPGGAGSANSTDVEFIIGAKPLYRQAPVADTVSVTNGLSVTVFLQPDE